jgi:RNA polymerase sigma-70 factor (ECF subfamily)
MNIDTIIAKRLYQEYGFVIYRTCLRILGSQDDAKDALQSVFLKLLESYESIHDKEKVVTWIFSAAKHYCFNQLRYQKKFLDGTETENLESSVCLEESITNRNLIKVLFSYHDKKVRDAVYYTFVENLDQNEIQKVCGQSPATVRRNLKRFKTSLPNIRKRLGI